MHSTIYYLYVLAIVLCILVPIADIIILIVKGRATASSSLLIILLSCVTMNCIGYYLEATSWSLAMIRAAIQLEFMGDMTFMLMFFFFSSWCGARLPKPLIAAVLLLYGVVFASALTSAPILFNVTGVNLSGDFPDADTLYGPLSQIETYANMILMAMTLTLLIRGCIHANANRRKKYLLMMAGYFLPAFVSLTYTISLFSLDPMPVALLVCNSILTWCVVTDNVYSVVERAHENLVEGMNESAIVLNPDGIVLYANPAARDLFPDIAEGHRLPIALESFCAAHDRDDVYYKGKYYKSSLTALKNDEDIQGQAALIVDVSRLQELKMLLEAENARIEEELSFATQIQAGALPQIFPPWPDRHDFQIYATMTPAKEVGGDFYDFFLVDNNHLGVVIADVSGKGVPAAMFMMNAKTCIKDRMMAGQQPDEAFEGASDQLVEGNDAELFVTCWAILIDLLTGDAVFANAGHNAPYIYRAARRIWEPIQSRANIVLADDIGSHYRLNDFHFEPGDVLFMYTDGLPEAADPDDHRYENARIEAVLAAQPDGVALDTLLPAMKADVDTFARGREQFDDITMVGLRIVDIIRRRRIPATLEASGEAAAFIQDWLRDFGCPDRPRRQILMAQDEIFSNIARYAYAGQEHPGDAIVELWLDGPSAVIRLSDRGIPFNPLDVTREIHDYDDDWDTGGDGISLVREMMDSLSYEYEDNQNRLTMKKRIF